MKSSHECLFLGLPQSNDSEEHEQLRKSQGSIIKESS